jgi:hypothetical protein
MAREGEESRVTMRGKLTIAALGVIGGAYVLDRLGRRWGATPDEVHATLPGDELVKHPLVQTTHAVTIHARPAEVWPWLVQMGYGRAGWYTNRWWYRLIDHYVWRTDVPRVSRIVPELQHIAKGDIIPDGPPGTASFTVARLEQGRALVLYSTTHGTVWLPPAMRDNPDLGIHGELGWAFVLREPAPYVTRLLLRTRVSGGPVIYRAVARALLPAADFLVARMMLRTIKQNVERQARASGKRSAKKQMEQASVPSSAPPPAFAGSTSGSTHDEG